MMTDPPRVPHSLPEPSRPQMYNPLLLNELCDTVEICVILCDKQQGGGIASLLGHELLHMC